MNYEKAYKDLLASHQTLEERLAKAGEERDIYDQILRSAKRSVALTDLDKKIVCINNTAVKKYGYTLDEVKGKKISDLIYGANTDASKVLEAWDKALNGVSSYFEYLAYSRTGEELWVRAEIQPYYNANGAIDKVIMYGLDIKDEKELQSRIQKAENRYNALLDNSPDIIYRTDLAGKVLSVNNTWIKLLGYTKEETLTKPANFYLFTEDIPQIEEEMLRVIESDVPSYNMDARFITKTGDVLWMNMTCTPVFSDTKEIIGFSGVSRNITNEKNNQYLKDLLAEQVSDLICLHDSQTRYTFVSPSIKEIAGYKPEELLGKPSFTFYHPDDVARVHDYRDRNIAKQLKPGESVALRFLKKDGTYTWLELTGKPIRDHNDNITGAITSCKVANLKKEEEDKIQAALEDEKKLGLLKSSFLRYVAHEFKAPISVIRALVELIQMSIEDNDVQTDQLSIDLKGIEVEIKSLIILMEDVLVLEELESGTIKLKITELCLIDLLKNVNERLPFEWRQKATIEIEGKVKTINGDKKYMELILKNLISNAFKYSEGKPYPMLKVVYSQKEVTVTVKDFGIGIPIESQGKLFTNFYRAGNVGKVDGTGLGLSIVKKFVELHDGSISFVSVQNKGTEMAVMIPMQ